MYSGVVKFLNFFINAVMLSVFFVIYSTRDNKILVTLVGKKIQILFLKYGKTVPTYAVYCMLNVLYVIV